MLLAKVIGTVVATRKNESLVGSKFLIVETLKEMKEAWAEELHKKRKK